VEIETGVFWCWKSNGRFLVLEEYNGRGKCESIFVLEGRDRQGWCRFIEELRSVIQFSAQSWELPKEKRRYSEVLTDTKKEGLKVLMASPASFQGNELTMKGAHAFSGSSNKCLSVEEGKKKDVGESHSCCAGYLSVNVRGALFDQIELLHVEIIKCFEQLKSCKCCPQHCTQGAFGKRMQEDTKKAQASFMDMDSGPEENNWIVRALATDSLKESVSLHLGKKREKTTKTSHSRSPTFNLFHWVSTVFPNA
jgi:hypothetical protein